MKQIDFSQFTGRNEALKKIIRYHSFPVMFYRSNLYTHSHRLGWMIEEVGQVVQSVYPQFNIERARTMAHVHDDLEIVLGDIMLAEKLKYTPEQLRDLEQKEKTAIEEVTKLYPESINGFSYKQLLLDYQNLDPEDVDAVVAKYFDKYDAFGEALHEVFAGNIVFTKPYNVEHDSPTDVYTNILQNFSEKYPLFQKIRETAHPLFQSPPDFDAPRTAENKNLHTLESLTEPTEYTPYNIWKQNVLKYGNERGREWLLTKVE